MATPSLQWDASLVSLKVTTASGGIITMAFPDRATDVSFNMPPTGFSNPLTTKGDLAIGDVDGFPARLAIGTDGQVLQSNGTTAVWATLSYITNPMTTAQDLIVGGASGAPVRLAVGTEGKVLGVSSGVVAWVTPSTGFANPMTAVGDLVLGGTDGAAGRLAIGAAGKVLTSNGTTATWEAPVTGFSNPMTTLGDIITADTGGTAKRVGVGSEGQILKVVSGEPAWAAESSGSLKTRSTVSHTTASLATNASEDFPLTITKMANVLKVTADYPCWVRLYGTAAARTADASRLITADPATGIGLYGEWSVATGTLSVTCSPIPCFQNSDTTPANTAYLAVKNLDSTARAISVGVTFVGLEA